MLLLLTPAQLSRVVLAAMCNNQTHPVHLIPTAATLVTIGTGPDLGGPWGPGPQASHQKGPPTKPFNFYFALTIW